MGSVADSPPKGGFGLVLQNPYLCGAATVSIYIGFFGWGYFLTVTDQFSTLGGLLFGYDQGVISGVITMESFGARFPHVFMDSGTKGWFVSTLLLSEILFFHACGFLDSLSDPVASCLVWIFGQWSYC